MTSSSYKRIALVANAQAIDPAKVALLQATNATFSGIDLETDYTDEVLSVTATADEGFLFQEAPHGYYQDDEGVVQDIEFTYVTDSSYTTTIDMSDVPEDGGSGNAAWVHLYANAVSDTAILEDFGTLNVFLPTSTQMVGIADKRYIRQTSYNPPMFDLGEFIVEINSLYITVPSSTTGRLKLGPYDQQLDLPVADDYIIETSCGSITIDETFENKADYEDVEVELFAPFVGIVKLDAARAIGRTLTLTYKTNILTGDSIMQLKSGDYILAHENCQVGFKVPYKYNDRYDIEKLQINSEFMMGTTPFIQLWLPKYVTGGYYGVEAHEQVVIGNVSGFVKLTNFDLSSFELTKDELDEITSLLESGVFIND